MGKQTENLINKFYEIEKTRGTNAKIEVLKKYQNDGAFTETLRWYFNNLIVSGLKERKIDKIAEKGYKLPAGIEGDIKTWGMMDLLSYLEENNSGRDYDAQVVYEFASQFDEDTMTGILRIATKSWDKGLGVGVTVCNKVFGDKFIPEFKVQLCEKYWDNPEYWEDKTFAISPKLDGYCVIAIKRNGKVKLFARSGKEYTGQFPEIETELARLKVDNVVFHAERMPLGFMTMDSKKQFKLAAAGQKKGEKTGYCLAIYDYIPLKDWDKQHCNLTYSERYSEYMSMLNYSNLKYLFPLPNLYVGDDTAQIEKWFQWSVDNEKEGIIIKNLEAMYAWERSDDYAKVKTIYDADLKVIGFEEGKGKLKKSLGAILLDYNGVTVRCGSGLKEVQRQEIWNNQKKYLGKIVEIVYMEESTDKTGKKSLRHPIFKTFKNGE